MGKHSVAADLINHQFSGIERSFTHKAFYDTPDTTFHNTRIIPIGKMRGKLRGILQAGEKKEFEFSEADRQPGLVAERVEHLSAVDVYYTKLGMDNCALLPLARLIDC